MRQQFYHYYDATFQSAAVGSSIKEGAASKFQQWKKEVGDRNLYTQPPFSFFTTSYKRRVGQEV